MATVPPAGTFEAPDVPDLAGLRACVRCGICLPQCPTYRLLGEEMDSPRGRIYLMRAAAEGRQAITAAFTRHLDLCLGCRACETACPSGVPFGALLEATRAQIEREGRPLHERMVRSLIFGLFPHPRRLQFLRSLLSFYQRSGLQKVVRASGLLRATPRLAAMDALLPPIPAPGALPEFLAGKGRRLGRVGLLTGCVQSVLAPQVNAETAYLLTRAGYDVVVPRTQPCCGALHLHGGRLADFRVQASALAAAFPDDLDVIVTNAAGCGSAVKAYGHWVPADARAERFAAKTRDISEVLEDADFPLGRLDVAATYHDACHLSHGQGIRTQPRNLLRRIPGLRLLELADSELCCGSAGIYNLLEPDMADRLLERKIERIVETGARVVLAGNPGCLLQIAKGCRGRGLDVEVLHPVELLARASRS
jgi:glycolate oxidase iron-sulfur subunit